MSLILQSAIIMSVITLSVIMLYVIFKLNVMSHMGYNEHQFAECPYSECHTECRCADSHDNFFNISLTFGNQGRAYPRRAHTQRVLPLYIRLGCS